MAGESCEFTFDPSERPDSHHDATLPDADLNADGLWECPHDALDGRDLCLAHVDGGPEGVDETDWLLDAVDVGSEPTSQRKRRRSKQFVAGQFHELDLASTAAGGQDNHPLDFRYAEIGSLRCIGLDLTRDVDLSMAAVGDLEMDGAFDRLCGLESEIGGADLDDGQFGQVDFRDASLGSVTLRNGTVRTIDLRNAEAKRVDLDEADVDRGHCDFLDAEFARGHHAEFGVVDFDNAAFGSVEFYYADFGEADFRNVAATDSVFKGAEFEGAYFNGSEFEVANWIGADVESGHFGGTRFDQASFRKSSIGRAGFEDSFFGWVNFQDADLERGDFSGTTFEHGSFRNAEFESADFTGVDPVGALNLKGAAFEGGVEIRPAPRAPPADSLVDLSESEISDGVLSQSAEGRVVYDLEGATVGTVRFEGRDDAELIRNVRFLRTRFEDFDFRDSDDIELKRTRYRLHEMFDGAEELAGRLRRYGVALAEARRKSPSAGEDDLRSRVHDRLSAGEIPPGTRPEYRSPSAADLEYTYLLAKNGANAIHDNESASMFFVREMQQRRRRHWELAREAETVTGRVKHGLDWLKNSVLGWSAGYGESPARVIYTSAVIIGAFSLLYYGLEPTLYENPLNFAVLSIGSFVTLIVGGIGEIPLTGVRFLTQIEAFVGAFLIAMFVFTLTRAIHR